MPDLSPLESPADKIIDMLDPHILAVQSSANSEDNPSYDVAMSGPFAAEYYAACQTELHTLQTELGCWELVHRNSGMNVLPSTWAFKCKRYPDGRVKKFKARFCARGDRQVEGLDYFETWSPVVQWTTVRLMLILATVLDLKSSQADITAAFVHAELPAHEQVYIHQPRGFTVNGRDYVLRLKRSLYGLKQSPRHFFKFLVAKLEKQGLKQSAFDPCLFIGEDVIVIAYVDDLLMYSQDQFKIDHLIARLQQENIWIRKEGSAEGFLGVDITPINGALNLTQGGLTDRIISALGLDADYTTPKDTPAECAALPKDADSPPANPPFNYASVVGMLLYLSGHSRPDIAFAVNQCARYTFRPTDRHVAALKRIGRYLKGTRGKGLVLRPSRRLKVDCYVDADFAGLWGQEDSLDPHCVRSRAGYVILVSDCPVLWKSILMKNLCLSTMEAEYCALSRSCKDLFPIIDQLKELALAVGLPSDEVTTLHTTIHEDNVGALTLAKLEPKRTTPRSKHYALHMHWFRTRVSDPAANMDVVKVDSRNQLGDIFTKGLGSVPFRYLRSKLMGWDSDS